MLRRRAAGPAAGGRQADLGPHARVHQRRCRAGRAAEGHVRAGAHVSEEPVRSATHLSRRRPHADRQQRDRAVDEAGGHWPKKLAFHRRRRARLPRCRPAHACQQRRTERPRRLRLREGCARSVAGWRDRLPRAPTGRLEGVPPRGGPCLPPGGAGRPGGCQGDQTCRSPTGAEVAPHCIRYGVTPAEGGGCAVRTRALSNTARHKLGINFRILNFQDI